WFDCSEALARALVCAGPRDVRGVRRVVGGGRVRCRHGYDTLRTRSDGVGVAGTVVGGIPDGVRTDVAGGSVAALGELDPSPGGAAPVRHAFLRGRAACRSVCRWCDDGSRTFRVAASR